MKRAGIGVRARRVVREALLYLGDPAARANLEKLELVCPLAGKVRIAGQGQGAVIGDEETLGRKFDIDDAHEIPDRAALAVERIDRIANVWSITGGADHRILD